MLPSEHESVAADVARLTGGRLVVSGIPEERADEVAALYMAAGAGSLTAEHSTTCEEWTAITFTRASPDGTGS